MDDAEVLKRIHSLVDEEHTLRNQGGPPDTQRLRELEVMLDQCWDLLRQRRARREFGEDVGEAHARDAVVVEGYQQ
jgi:hypothetical protein